MFADLNMFMFNRTCRKSSHTTASYGDPNTNQSLTFLGSTNLAQLGRPLSESLRVGPPAVSVDLGVSRVVLPCRSGLPRRPAGRDEFWDT